MIRDTVRKFLTDNRASDDSGDFTDQESLLESGILDSLAMVDLITHLETTFGIAVDEDDMVPENFDSVDAIVAYVERVQGKGGSSGHSTPTTS